MWLVCAYVLRLNGTVIISFEGYCHRGFVSPSWLTSLKNFLDSAELRPPGGSGRFLSHGRLQVLLLPPGATVTEQGRSWVVRMDVRHLAHVGKDEAKPGEWIICLERLQSSK